MSDPSRRLLSRGMLYTLGAGAPALASLIVLPVAARLMPTDAFGELTLGLVIINLGAILLSLGVPASITRHGLIEADGLDGARGLYFANLAITAFLTLATMALAVILPFNDQANPSLVVLSLAVAGSFAGVMSGQSYHRAADRPGRFIAAAAVSNLGGALVGLVLVVAGPPSSLRYMTGLLIGSLAANLLNVWWVRGDGRSAVSKANALKGLRIGLPTLPHLLALVLAPNGLVLVSNAIGGLTLAAEFRLAMVFGTLPSFLVGALNNAWAPLIYRTAPEARGTVLQATTTDLARLIALCSAAIGLLAPWLAVLVAPPEYDRASIGSAMAVLAVSGVFAVFYLASVHLVFADGRTGLLALATPVSVVAGLFVGFVAGRSLGLVGVALGLPTVYLLNGVWTRLLARRSGAPEWSIRGAVIPALSASLVSALCAVFPGANPIKLVLAGSLALLAVHELRRIQSDESEARTNLQMRD